MENPISNTQVGPGDQVAPLENQPLYNPVSPAINQEVNFNNANKPKTKLFFWIALIVGIVAVLGGGAWAYVTYWYFPPEKVLLTAFKNFSSSSSLETNIKLIIEANNTSLPLGGLTPNNGSAGAQKAKLSAILNGKYNGENFENLVASNELVIEGSEGLNMGGKIALSVRTFGTNVSYLQINDLPSIPFVNVVSPFKDKWIKIDLKELEELYKKFGLTKVPKPNIRLSDQELTFLKQAFLNLGVIAIASDLGSTTINNQESYHYALTINKDGLKNFLQKCAEVIKKVTDNKNFDISELNKAIDKVESWPEMQVWISKKGLQIQQFTLQGQIKERFVEGKFTVEAGFKNFNKDIVIEQPTDYKSLSEILSNLATSLGSGFMMPPLNGGGGLGVLNSEIDSDNDGLSNSIEQTIGTNPIKADTDNDGYNDGQEIDGGYNPLGPGKLEEAGNNISPTLLALQSSQKKARDIKRISDIKQIQAGLELYFADHNNYPTGEDLILGQGEAIMLYGNGFGPSTGMIVGYAVYMSKVPVNPTPGGMPYKYSSSSDRKSYVLRFGLELPLNNLSAGEHIANQTGIR